MVETVARMRREEGRVRFIFYLFFAFRGRLGLQKRYGAHSATYLSPAIKLDIWLWIY